MNLKHADGSKVCELYGAHTPSSASPMLKASEQRQPGNMDCLPGAIGQGPIVAFNLFRSCDAYVGYRWLPALSKPCICCESCCQNCAGMAGLAALMLRWTCIAALTCADSLS